MPLHLHRAERADALASALALVLARDLPDPMTPEVVAVPTRGVERWLSQYLSGHLGTSPGRADGVCANVDFPFPGRLVGGAVAAGLGHPDEEDPWAADRCVWPLLDVVDASLGEEWLGALAVGSDRREGEAPGRRFASVRHVADLFERYGLHRPAMLSAWAAGDDVDGSGRPLPAEAHWQAELWRRLRARIGVPAPAERLAAACAGLRGDPGLSELPARVFLFGLTRLPVSSVEVLRALASGRDVHLLLLHPSPAVWNALRPRSDVGPPGTRLRRVDDTSATLARHPLLLSWGADAREMQLALGPSDSDRHHPPTDAEDRPSTPEPPRGTPPHPRRATAEPTLLARLQADIGADRLPPGPALSDPRPALAPADRSVAVHSCHGRARQVEVIRDAILHLLADDDTLEARDIIVMCPDIEAFAPLVHATFGAGDDAAGPVGSPDLRVRLADRSLRQTNPLLGVVADLTDLASARLTASEILDFASREPVRRRFLLDDDDLSRIEEWVAATGVRWGFDAAHRAPFRLGRIADNTWRSGLDRILAGVAMAEVGHRLVGGVLPLDDVDSGSIDLAGRLAELLERLAGALASLTGPQPVEGWCAALQEAVASLTSTSGRDAWQVDELHRLLETVLDEAGTTRGSGGAPRQARGSGGAPRAAQVALSLSEIRALLADRLQGRPTRANFRTGHLTVCTLVPMRSVPHRVVCLLGLDDGVFPRRSALDGDDLVGADPHVGDCDTRREDRQLLLDALMAAGDHLVVTFSGRDERTNAERPPAVPIGELLDVIDATVTGPEGGPARDRVVVQHPLQPFDPRNFTSGGSAGGSGEAGPWGFDPVALEGARALAAPVKTAAPPFLSAPLAPASGSLAELDGLIRFVSHPVRAFLRQRLGVSLGEGSDEVADGLPVELGPLSEWAVGERLLEARLAGADVEAVVAAELARGTLPPGALADPVLSRVGRAVESLVGEAGLDRAPTSVEVRVRLVDGRRLVGTIPGVEGDVIRSVNYSRVGPRPRLVAWVRLLALTAAHPDRAWEAVTVGRRRFDGARGAHVTVARLAALASDPADRAATALAHLRVLCDLYDRGLCEPLPVFCRTSAAWAEARHRRRSAEVDAAREWESSWDRSREDAEPEHLLVQGGPRSLASVLAQAPAPGEDGPGWAETEPTRLGRLARRLWDPLLAVEEVRDR